MNRTVLTYDVRENHEAIKKTLLEQGWKVEADTTRYLPNTTLWHPDTTAESARDEFKLIAGIENISRCMCYEFNTWSGRIDTTKQTNKR